MTARPLRATARLQFHRGFTLDDAVGVVPYLDRLGISHVYASPLLTARAGSTHGYDIVDHRAINPELGGEAALRRLVDALRSHDMGLIVDIVPNHMGVGGADNAWWLDVLEWGQASPYAAFFDIDWSPPDADLRGKVLAPFLGRAFGACLADGEIALRFDAETGRFDAWYHDHRFPLAPATYALVLQGADGAVMSAAALFASLPRAFDVARRQAEEARRALIEAARDPAGAAMIESCLARIDVTRLDGLLNQQNYRLAFWRTAADEINWRRFFDVTTLAGLRVELPEVFDATHELILRLYREELIDGVRIDHIDGLADPRGYCRKLQRLMTAIRPSPYLIVEKILAPHERLPDGWMTDGTSGYDFMDSVGGLLHDPDGEQPLLTLWRELTGNIDTFAEIVRQTRRQVLRDLLASELNANAAALHRVARADIMTRDVTLTGIRRALTELLVNFPVYRVYVGPAGESEVDKHVLARATAGARRGMRRADRAFLDLVAGWIGGDGLRTSPPGARRRGRLRAIAGFQQLSAPVAAKSVEDTAFYRYGPLLSRNEVGSDPAVFSVSPAAFHAANRDRARRFPRGMLATATHDHKRGEDARARLAVLSEIPAEWAAALNRWTRLNASLRREVDGGPAPDASDELMVYQTLVSAWPNGLEPGDQAGVESLIGRVGGWQEKALREAKVHSEWAEPNEAYEAACRDFLTGALDPARVAPVAQEIAAFAGRIALPGAVNGLAQTLLRMTAPGVPDLYQGCELWDLSLVDPDNRRPVDFNERSSLLARAIAPADALRDWRSGAIKQAIIARTLQARACYPALFADGAYRPLTAKGPHERHVVAFGRFHAEQTIVVAVTRLAAGLLGEADVPHVAPDRWQDDTLPMPRLPPGKRWIDVLGDLDHAPRRELGLGAVLGRLPVALLIAG